MFAHRKRLAARPRSVGDLRPAGDPHLGGDLRPAGRQRPAGRRHTPRARLIAAALLSLGLLAGCTTVTTSGTPLDSSPSGLLDSGLPRTAVWSSYPVGTSNYAEQAAVAEVLTDTYGTQVRMLGSDTGLGRVTPLRTGQAQIARLSDEAFYAFEAKYEFVSPDWGPQDLRTIWTPPTTVTIGVAADSGIESLADLKGKRVPWMTANPSTQEKILGTLAFAGLQPEDVVKVPTEYSAQPALYKNGGLDAVFIGAQSAAIIEADAQKPLRWVDYDGDAEALALLQDYAPSVQLAEVRSAIGLGDEPVLGPTYAIQMTTYAGFDADEVYAMVRAFDESFPRYRGATATTPDWDLESIDWMPVVLPHHDGLVRYLEEKGLWSPAHEQRNAQLIERGERLRAGWQEVSAETPADELAEVWESWKAEHAPHVPIAAAGD